MSTNDDRNSYAAHNAYLTESTPCNELGFVTCRDFVWQVFDSIRLRGTVREINSLMEKVNLGFNVRPTSNSDDLSALHALTIGLETTNPHTSISFNDLRDILNSGAYKNLAESTVKSHPMPSEQRRELYQRITAAKDLPLTAMLVLLNLLGRFSGQVYELGVLSFQEALNDIPVFRVQLHSTNPNASATKIIWIGKDCLCTQINITKPQWSGIAPIPLGEATSINAQTCSFDTNLPQAAVDDQEDEDDITDYDLEDLQQSHNRGRDSRRTIRGAPSRNTQLPIEMLSDVTLEKLIIYYPEHVLHWPGLALVVLHTCIRSRVKGATGFKYITDLISESRLGEDSNMLKLSRATIRFWLKEAVKTLLGPHYGTNEETHMKCLYKAISNDHQVQNVAEFLQKHLWDPPVEDTIAGLHPPEPLHTVRESVINHPEHGIFKDLVLSAVADMNVSVPQLPSRSRLHPIVLKLNDFTQSSADLQTSTAAGTAKPTSGALARDRYPTHVSQEDMINRFWPDLYGEPLLWALLGFSMADIAKRISEEAYRTYSKTRSQFETTLRQRRRTALKDRADRLNRPLNEILSEYERETTDFGARKGRNGRWPNRPSTQETEANCREGEINRVSQGKRKREHNTDDGEPQNRRGMRRRRDFPSLPALSPPAPEETWEFPPESEFRLKHKPGLYSAAKKGVSRVEPTAVTDPAAPATPHLSPPSHNTQMGFGSQYESEDDFEQTIIAALQGYSESDPMGGH